MNVHVMWMSVCMCVCVCLCERTCVHVYMSGSESPTGPHRADGLGRSACACVCVCVWVPPFCRCLQRPGKDVRSLGAGFPGPAHSLSDMLLKKINMYFCVRHEHGKCTVREKSCMQVCPGPCCIAGVEALLLYFLSSIIEWPLPCDPASGHREQSESFIRLSGKVQEL